MKLSLKEVIVLVILAIVALIVISIATHDCKSFPVTPGKGIPLICIQEYGFPFRFAPADSYVPLLFNFLFYLGTFSISWLFVKFVKTKVTKKSGEFVGK